MHAVIKVHPFSQSAGHEKGSSLRSDPTEEIVWGVSTGADRADVRPSAVSRVASSDQGTACARCVGVTVEREHLGDAYLTGLDIVVAKRVFRNNFSIRVK
jgi:hypothetical protein